MSEQNLNVRYKPTMESYLVYYATYMKDSAIAKKSVRSPLYVFIAMFIGLLFCVGVMLLQGSGVLFAAFPHIQESTLSWFASVFLAGTMAGMAGYILIYKSIYAAHVLHLASAMVNRGLTHDITLDDTGIHCNTEWGNTNTLWVGVERVYVANDIVVIILKPDHGLPIPYSAFQNAAHRETFIAYIKNKITA